uniref:hypothetical protein n=1 Tax=Pseudomonas laurentiana TaxID=2364649 RepID=UPI0029C8944A|nr:hypothetical protein [Pseudomonas laurentiana]
MNAGINKDELEVMLRSEDSNVVIDALMYICFNVDEPEWVEQKCIDAIEFGADDNVRGLAITCIGHVARIYSRISLAATVPVLRKYLDHKVLGGRARDALDDIEIFVK